MILVSIVVPIYNAEKYLRRCLDSLINQTLDEIEIIAINDGSTDGSVDILNAFWKKHKDKLRVFHQENMGISASRNRGIELAKGEYITFIDSDDSVDIEFCQRMIGKIQSQKSDMVVCDFFEVYGESKKENKIPGWEKTTVVERPELLFDINTSPWNKIYRKKFLDENNVRFPLGVKYEDAVFLQKILACKAQVAKLDVSLIYYLVHPGSETTVVKESVFDIFEILNIICCEYKNMSEQEYQKIYKCLEYFVINRVIVYNLQQIYQEKAELVEKFIDKGFDFLDGEFPNWRRNYLFNRENGFIKRTIKKNKWITKIVVWGIRKLKKQR